MRYLFETDQFGLTNESLHLLRSRFNYKTHQDSEISALVLTKGRIINNWLVVLILGIALVGFAIFYAIGVYRVLNDDQVSRIYIEEIVVPVIPFLLGLYSVYASLRTGPVLKVAFQNGKTKSFPVDKAQKKNGLDNLTSLLKNSESWKNKSKIVL